MTAWRRWLAPMVIIAVAALVLLGLGAWDLRRHPPARLLLSAHHEWDYVRAVERAMSQAQKRIWVMMYVARLGADIDPEHPVEFTLQALVDAAKRGVDVRVCLDQSRNWEDPTVIDSKHEQPAAWLRARGVRVIEDELERISHAKVVLIDNETVVIGSHNWTFSALALNREASLFVKDAALAAEIDQELFQNVPGWNLTE